MPLQKYLLIGFIVSFLPGNRADKPASNTNTIQVVDDSTISRSPCCGRLNITAEPDHGLWMIHFNKLGTYTLTNTLVRNRNTWINDKDPEFLISWCGQFWHIGHRGEAGQCNGYVSSPDNTICFHQANTFRHYVHCINEWVDAAPSNLRMECLDGRREPAVRDQELQDRIDKLEQQKVLEIDPRALD